MRFLNPANYDKGRNYTDGTIVVGADGDLFVFWHKYWRRRGVEWPRWWEEI